MICDLVMGMNISMPCLTFVITVSLSQTNVSARLGLYSRLQYTPNIFIVTQSI